jgi:cellulose synthase/poly-beta-1,6-N-acetylglucosamine synthase-like glycosyltransferase
MLQLLSGLVAAIYFSAAGLLLLYGCNCYLMILMMGRRRRCAARVRESVRCAYDVALLGSRAPVVTTQIPIYNELNVAERVITAACSMRYPPERHEIQVLDDSSDETRALIDRVVARLQAEGHRVSVIRRASREGYKAGALAHGLARARGEFIVVFDADFVPPADFLLRTMPFLLADPELGLVQARWGHCNRAHSLLTRAQSIGIDGHFLVEQSARAWNGLFMNFNGTAGIWRRSAIEAAGGWEWDTLTEDMDLSYRVQLAGWRAAYIPDVVVPAEIPEDVNAFKSQQFRWAKGSIQTARKLLPRLLRARLPLFLKLQAVLHMTHYLVHPLMLLLALLALPVLLTFRVGLGAVWSTVLGALLLASLLAPSSLYLVSQRTGYADWRRRVLWLPMLVVIGVGLAVSNTRAVLQALRGLETPFVRTPKRGDLVRKSYRVRLPWLAAGELLLGLYCAYSLRIYIGAGKYLIGPFLGVYVAGFLFMGLLTVAHTLGLDAQHRWIPAARPRRATFRNVRERME